MKMKVLAGIVILALIGTGYYYTTGKTVATEAQVSAPQPPPVEVTVFTITPQKTLLTRDLSGRTSSYQVAEIRPQVTGIIVDRLFTEGSLVKAGQQLYQIDPAPYEAVHASNVANLRKAEANLKAVEPKAKRYQKLVEIGGVSRQSYEDTVAALEQAKADVAVAQAAVTASKINLDYTKVFAPISGQIGKSSVTKGALVTANQATALATIQNLSKIYVDVSQSSTELMNLRKQVAPGDKTGSINAELILEGEKEPYELKGEVQFSDISVDEGTGMVQLRILFPNPDRYLLPGLFVKARVAQTQLENAILVPQQSVIRSTGGVTTVWAVGDDNIVNTRPVEVTKALGDKWLISSGLQAGDKVVVAGLQKIKPGATVTPVETSTSAQ
ncbi:membrane fusion protein, multidrug efflux system [Desulfuromusa kysingii]|uniref:Membrane fusion protein, multidrug efflux system n=1 Tax=Desulfuromusa kysingii TaxID=37625 RepID=A0A1H3YCB8_9BACT|nr:efflux RND transporter periplasmic adaptor subunit [Desulfuromusa kysingii]SEA08701.1 membrane fusion protein, multidrug efflux system [Desulfuromusa kysingii]